MVWWQRWFKREPSGIGQTDTSSLKNSEPKSSPDLAFALSGTLSDGQNDPVILDITDVLDLHAFAPSDVGDVVEAYLEEAHLRGYLQVRIIHGKGIGVQRERVRAILRRTPWVLHYEEAPPEAGSWGATIAWLRPIEA